VSFYPAHETVWLSEVEIADLRKVATENTRIDLCRIINEGEIDTKATTKDFSVVRKEGKRNVRKQDKYHNR